jgi:hypothetical protein
VVGTGEIRGARPPGSSLEPAPPNLPRIREFQRAQGDAALSWLWSRLGWSTVSQESPIG